MTTCWQWSKQRICRSTSFMVRQCFQRRKGNLPQLLPKSSCADFPALASSVWWHSSAHNASALKVLPVDWWWALPKEAPLLDAARWTKTIATLTPQDFSDGNDHRPLLEEIIETLREGLIESAKIGERLLDGKALAVWRKALTEGPPAALDVTLTGLRVDDGIEPGSSIVWGPAAAIAAVPRPLSWLVGLTSRSWPRRASEDPLSSEPHHSGGSVSIPCPFTKRTGAIFTPSAT